MSKLMLRKGQLYQCVDEEDDQWTSRCMNCGDIFMFKRQPDYPYLRRRCDIHMKEDYEANTWLTSEDGGKTWVPRD